MNIQNLNLGIPTMHELTSDLLAVFEERKVKVPVITLHLFFTKNVTELYLR